MRTLLVLLSFFAFNCSSRNLTTPQHPYPFQEKILEYILGDTVPHNAGYYWPKADNPDAEDDSTYLGTTINIDYLGTRLSTARENQSTHCVGVSWQVSMAVLQDWSHSQNADGAIMNLSIQDVSSFLDKWFIKLEKAGLDSLLPPAEMGAVHALISYQLGDTISFGHAQAGDFVQFWRKDNSGHSCIFLHWIYDKSGQIIGFQYWGSQPQTNGIGTETEYFYPAEHTLNSQRLVDKKRFYVGRLSPKMH